jgi:ribosome-associated translation inhibitor RaiA
MRTDVRITQTQADAHHSDLLTAIGATAPDAERWIARREERRERRRERRSERRSEARRRHARGFAWRRRPAQA